MRSFVSQKPGVLSCTNRHCEALVGSLLHIRDSRKSGVYGSINDTSGSIDLAALFAKSVRSQQST